MLVQKPLPIAVKPASLDLAVKEGRFTAQLKVAVADASKDLATFTAELEGNPKELRLVGTQLMGSTLTVEFESTAVGRHQGALLVYGAASVPLEPARVPFKFRVSARSLGLDLPASREIRLVSVLANSGKKDLARWEIPSSDTEPVPYRIDVQNLSNGSAVIPVTTDRATISPTKDKPAALALTAEVGNVPAGEYKGALLLKGGTGPSAKTWRTELHLTITEPLVIKPIDLGTVEVGKVVKRSFVIKNSGGAFRDVTIRKPGLPTKGDAITVKVQEKIDLAAGAEKEIPLTVAIPPLVESCGPLKSTLVVRRTGSQEIAVPIQGTIVDEGKGPSALLAAPAKVELSARPGDVVQFDLRVKLSADATADADEITASVGAFTDGKGQRADVDIAVKWQEARPTRTASAVGRGSIIAPDNPGSYKPEITIRSGHAGSITIPVILEVK